MLSLKRKTENEVFGFKAVIFEDPRKCPKCGIEPNGEKNTDFRCPTCGQGFCTCCYELDDCDDSEIICPHCSEKLIIRFF